jgi:hypothetical protein
MIVTRWSHLMAHEPLVDGAFDRSWVTSLLSWSMTCFFALMAHAPSSHRSVVPMSKESGRRWRRRCRVGVNGIARTAMNFIANARIRAVRLFIRR